MSGHLVCKSGFGLGKVAKLMLASVVVLSAFSGNVWANEAEVPQEPVEKKKEGGKGSWFWKKGDSEKEDLQKLPPKNIPSITTSSNTEKTPLKDFSVTLGPAKRCCAPWLKKGEVDLSMLKKRISLLLHRVTNYGPGTPGFGISENIVELFNNKGTIVVPEDIARDLCRLPSGKAMLYEWKCFTDEFARYIAEMLTVNAYGELSITESWIKKIIKSIRNKGMTKTMKELSSKGMKETLKDIFSKENYDYYKSRHDSYDKVRKHVLSALTRKPNFDAPSKQMESDTKGSTAETPSTDASA
ncbi:putative integral membrane protein [Babesia bovis T2Bo]|uniref:Membrane protein, putative n=1 Tax=Babesia bovis TaxID=5865 RepID=A7ATH7_BABBO|nr:putative integral membrane protein [Babesia bovis T2Bo]EDO06238.1 putative integral membrane protein [Babesia bovis T2Bo]|eukprot:XP_001609806.1 membrane protein [Babesia bovis T2Bo]